MVGAGAPVDIDGGASTTFVGRESELACLEASWGQARAGAPQIVTVEGPAGIGKTALMARFTAGIDSPSVLHAQGNEDEGLFPYGVVEQLLVDVPAGAELLTRLRRQRGEDPLTAGVQLLEVLDEVQGEGPVLVVVDDSHWADAPSAKALAFALRRLHFDRVLAVLALRPNETMPEALGRLAGTERARRLRLTGLDVSELSELSLRVGTGPLPRFAAERLEALTDGNPLYARSVLDEVDVGLLGQPEEPPPAPRFFVAGVVARLGSCSPDARNLVEAASVLGRSCSLGLAARVGQVGDVADALSGAVAANLIEACSPATAREIRFPHPLIQAAVYHDLLPGRRVALHEGAAATVDERAALEHRIAAALVEDDDLATKVAAYARGEAAAGASTSAAGHLVAAARLSSQRSQREELFLEAIEQLLVVGELVGATALAAETVDFAPTALHDYILGHLALLTGRSPEAVKLLAAAWHACRPETDDRLAALVSALLTITCTMQGRSQEAVGWARHTPANHAEPRLAGRARWATVMALGVAGRSEEALALVAGLSSDAGGLSAGDVGGLLGRGHVRLWTDDLCGSRADLSAVVRATRSRPASLESLSAQAFLADVTFRQGAWDESIAHGALAVSLVHDADHVWMLSLAHAMSTWVPAARGDFEQAAMHVRVGGEAAKEIGDAMGIALVATAAAHLEYARANLEGVTVALQPLLDLPGQSPVVEPGVLRWRELGAVALVGLGRLDEAEELLVPLEDAAREHGRASSLLGAARVRAALESARGDNGRADEAFDAALAFGQGVSMPFERALLAHDHGRFLRRLGQRRAAAKHLQAAFDVFARLGAVPFAERTEREFAACGLRPRARSSSVRTGLTPQELAVARLVASGATNREVAAELVVSVKTIEYHLGNVFSKMSVTSRSQLANRFSVLST